MWKNLYIVDGNSFATSAAVNPTSTIGALALRAAEKIWQEQKSKSARVPRNMLS